MATTGRRRAYGQHYLNDSDVISGIAELWQDSLHNQPVEHLLEIGPGDGALTYALLDYMKGEPSLSLTIGEHDPRLIEKWGPKLEPLDRVRLSPGDYSDIAPSEFLPPDGKPLGVVSNLPYSAGTAIFLHLIDNRAQIPWMVLMFQAEVAQRLRAEPGKKTRGSLTIWTQTFYEVEHAMTVPPEAFTPPPEVMSEVVTVRRKAKPEIDLSEPDALRKWSGLLKQSFSQPRKMIRSNLGKSAYGETFNRSGVSPTLRPAQLEWDDWRALAKEL